MRAIGCLGLNLLIGFFQSFLDSRILILCLIFSNLCFDLDFSLIGRFDFRNCFEDPNKQFLVISNLNPRPIVDMSLCFHSSNSDVF